MPYRRFTKRRATGRRFGRRGTFRRRIRRGVTRRVGNYGRFNKLARFQGGSSKTPEKKYFDCVYDPQAFAASAEQIYSLLAQTVTTMAGPAISQGSNLNNRLGTKITVTHIQIRFMVSPSAGVAGLNSANWGMAYLILDTQCNGATIVQRDVLAYVNNSGVLAEGNDTYQFLNPANTGRFRILKSKKVILSMFNNVTGNITGVPHSFEWNLKCRIPIDYRNDDGNNTAVTTGVISTIRSNNIIFMYCPGPSYSGNYGYSSRIRFTDA